MYKLCIIFKMPEAIICDVVVENALGLGNIIYRGCNKKTSLLLLRVIHRTSNVVFVML